MKTNNRNRPLAACLKTKTAATLQPSKRAATLPNLLLSCKEAGDEKD